MTATDELRRMLDERDEYYKTSGNKTWWGRPIDRQTGKPINVFHNQAQPMGEDRLLVELQLATPEQAIAATLGREPDDAAIAKLHDQMNAAMLKYEMAQGIEKRDGDGAIVVPWVLKMHALLEEAATLGLFNCTNNCTNSERTEACLPHFWTHDGTLHIELPKLPESISVRLPDQRDRDVSSARVWQYTRDSGTCHECADMDKEIVRCRDCKRYSEHEWIIATDVSDVCHFWHGEPTKVEPDGFCAWGERKEVEDL